MGAGDGTAAGDAGDSTDSDGTDGGATDEDGDDAGCGNTVDINIKFALNVGPAGDDEEAAAADGEADSGTADEEANAGADEIELCTCVVDNGIADAGDGTIPVTINGET